MGYACTLRTGAFVGGYGVGRRGGTLLFRAQAQAGTLNLYATFPLQYLFGQIPGGVYWKPIYHVLVGVVEVIVGKAREMRPRPGHKTAPAAARWIAALLAPGLSRPRFLPPPPIGALRDLTRTWVALVQTRSQSKHRVYKSLEDTNSKLASVVTDLFGKSGRRMLAALLAGERDPPTRAALALGQLRRKVPELALALTGQCTDHHGRLIQAALDLIDLLNRQIANLDQQVGELLGLLAPQIEQLTSIPGVEALAARTIFAEIGTNRSRFGSDARLASWAGMCPGKNESAGKRRRGKTRQGNRSLRRVFGQCAWTTRKTPTFLGRTCRRLEGRLGGQKAALAVGHKILVIVYHLLAEGTFYEEARDTHLQPRQEAQQRQRALKALERLGSHVTLECVA
jgi:transposase